MNIIFVTRKHGKAYTFSLGNKFKAAFAVLLMTIAGGGFYFGYRTAADEEQFLKRENYVNSWQEELKKKGQFLERLKHESSEQLKLIYIRVAELHAKLIRLDALGEHISKTAKISSEEFNFSKAPALGGPESPALGPYFQPPNFILAIDELAKEIQQRENELEILNTLLGNKDFDSDRYISGRPVRWGWVSSKFGRRNDPFTGRIAWHEGVDIAGRDDSDIIAVAAGVVTWSGPRDGYGNLIELSHGGNYSTRYGHAKKLLANVGDVVEKGQSIAIMGSTGRSTGPHVHYEVLRNGKPVDPSVYITRKAH
jgi:murein DD-endopeptidase MepM/ murein hydrolase activator NlpD